MTDEEKTNQDMHSKASKTGDWDHKKDKYEENGYYRNRRSMFFGLVGLIILLVVIFSAVGAAVFGHNNNNRIGRVSNVAIERNFDGEGMGMMGRDRSFRGSEQVTGKVTAVNGKTFAINVGSNQTKDVLISDTTRFPISSNTDIAVGDSVTVSGGQDSDGVIQAVRIVIN